MANDSSTGGALLPASSPAPLEDAGLLDFLHDWVQGITGLPATMIRPRWQPEPPNIPDEAVDWAAFGIMRREADTFVYEEHHPDVNGYDELRRHEILHILLSFYGQNADNYCSLLREGMQVAQNREVLGLAGMGVINCGDISTVPEFVKEKWLYRTDLPFSIRRQIIREYPVLNLLSSVTQLNNEHTSIIINN